MSIKIWVLTLLSVISGNLFCMDYPPVPAEVQQILDQHPDQIESIVKHFNIKPHARLGLNVLQPDYLPGYLIKNGIKRVLNREKLNRVIGMYQLDLLSVPNKYLYHLPNRSERVSDQNYIVIAEKINGKNGAGQNLTLAQTQQLWEIAKLANYCDLHCENYITTADGKVCIIDTDEGAIPMQPADFTLKLKRLVAHNEQKQHFSPEACGWLTDTIKQHDAQKLPAKRRR